MPSPGKNLPSPPSRGWLWATLGTLVLVTATFAAMYQPEKTSLTAGEVEKGKASPTAAATKLASDPSAHVVKNSPQPISVVPVSASYSTANSSPNYGDSGQLIPAIDLTAEALTRHLQGLNSAELRKQYSVVSMPSGNPSTSVSAPAKASPNQ